MEVYVLFSKRIRIPALLLLSCFALLGLSMGLEQTLISINSSGTIDYKRGYICGNYNSTHYYAQNKVTGEYELMSTDATQTISYALSRLTPGRTWQETILLIGNFLIRTQITLNDGNVLLDFSQATVTVATTGTTIAFKAAAPNITFYGGHKIQNTSSDPLNPTYTITTDPSNSGGHITGSGNPYYAFQTASSYTTFDGFDISGFGVSRSTGGGCIAASSRSSNMTVQNCYMHGQLAADYITEINLLSNSGYHDINHNILDVSFTGIMIAGNGHNTIKYNEFLNWHVSLLGHAIYSDGSAGWNEVAYNYFHDGTRGNAIYFKSPYNLAHDNLIKNLNTGSAPAIQLFAELNGYTTNYNEIYNNRIESCVLGFWMRTGSGQAVGNLIHNNTFYDVQNVIELTGGSGDVQDNKFYYNDFYGVSGRHPFPSQSGASNIQNTVIAYNYFDANVSSADVSWIESCSNTMIYQNTFFPPNTGLAMANFNYAEVTNPASWYYVAPRA